MGLFDTPTDPNALDPAAYRPLNNAGPLGMLSSWFAFPNPAPATPFPPPPGPAAAFDPAGNPRNTPAIATPRPPASAPADRGIDQYLLDRQAAVAPMQSPSPAWPANARAVTPASLWGRLVPALSDNASMLMALGGGLAGARTWGEGIGRGLTQAAQISLEQQKLEEAQRSQGATYMTLLQQGVPPHLALTAAQNPQFLRFVLSNYARPPGPVAPQANALGNPARS